MEDWEQFFVEKSRRRADRERQQRRRQVRQAVVAGIVLALAVCGGIMALTLAQS